jgi:hypothetical protein
VNKNPVSADMAEKTAPRIPRRRLVLTVVAWVGSLSLVAGGISIYNTSVHDTAVAGARSAVVNLRAAEIQALSSERYLNHTASTAVKLNIAVDLILKDAVAGGVYLSR